MDFGLLYELQMPRPWEADAEKQVFAEAMEQIVFAVKMGFSHVWFVEHHMLPEWSHSSAPRSARPRTPRRCVWPCGRP